MTPQEQLDIIEEICKTHVFRLERWGSLFDGELGNYRAGLDWFGEDDNNFVCEYPTIEECLKRIQEYIIDEDTELMFANLKNK